MYTCKIHIYTYIYIYIYIYTHIPTHTYTATHCQTMQHTTTHIVADMSNLFVVEEAQNSTAGMICVADMSYKSYKRCYFGLLLLSSFRPLLTPFRHFLIFRNPHPHPRSPLLPFHFSRLVLGFFLLFFFDCLFWRMWQIYFYCKCVCLCEFVCLCVCVCVCGCVCRKEKSNLFCNVTILRMCACVCTCVFALYTHTVIAIYLFLPQYHTNTYTLQQYLTHFYICVYLSVCVRVCVYICVCVCVVYQ